MPHITSIDANKLEYIQQKFASICFYCFPLHVPYTYTVKQFFFQVYCGLKSCASLLENVSLRVPPSNLRDFSLFDVVPLLKTILLLSAPLLLPMWRVKASTCLQSEPFLSITLMLINLNLLILSVHNPNVLSCRSCYLSSSSFVCLLFCIVFFLQHLSVICL
jgi:hypothetical protein